MPDDPTNQPHAFVRPGQAAPDQPPADRCARCGEPEVGHSADPDFHRTYSGEANGADEMLDSRLAEIRRWTDSGDIGLAEAADLRCAALEQHIATIRDLREEFFGGNSQGCEAHAVTGFCPECHGPNRQ